MLRRLAIAGIVIVFLILAAAFTEAPSIAAGGLLYPRRLAAYNTRPEGCVEREFSGDAVVLKGWFCAARTVRRGSVIYLHGVADNRSSSTGVIDRMTRRGFDVIAYDSRAHGESTGDVCTYGFYEKGDLRRVIDVLGPGPIVLIGNSLGAAVALQGAVGQQRVATIVAAEAFSDLRTIATERAPSLLPGPLIDRAFIVAEERGRFDADRVSPVDAAASLRIPVLLIHGAADRDTTPDHSKRILDALAGPKKLMLVPGAGHNQSMAGAGVWDEIDRWIDDVVGREQHTAESPRPKA